MCNGSRDPVTTMGCFVAMQLGLWQILPPFRPSVRPPHRDLVYSGERYSFLCSFSCYEGGWFHLGVDLFILV